jgi:hypothetical protein
MRYNYEYEDETYSRNEDTDRRRPRLLEPLLRQTDYQRRTNDFDDEEEEDEEDYIVTAETSDSDSSSSGGSDDTEEEEEEEEEDNDTITESFPRSRVDIYRLAIRTNSQILEDLAAIIRILRQINALYRVFHNNNSSNSNSNNFTAGLFRSSRYNYARRRNSSSISSLRRNGNIRRSRFYSRTSLLPDAEDNIDDNMLQEEHDDIIDEDDEDDDEEANKLLEAGLEDLQAVLSSDSNYFQSNQRNASKRQSTLALLALITYQYNHCSDQYLRRYLDPNGEYDPNLAIFAAATYDEEDTNEEDTPAPKSCRDIMIAAEELYGPDWLEEFHKGKEGALRKMLEKLTFVAKIRLKVRDLNPAVLR